MDVKLMTAEETEAYIKKLETANSDAEEKIKNITLELDSYKDELEKTKTELTKTETNLADAKKLNFTLARTVSNSDKKTSEELLYDMFFNKK